MRRELFDILRYWMELGVDGFRFDVINFIVKDAEFRSNPYRFHRALPRRYEQQDHLYDRTRPESHTYLKEMRRVLDEYPEKMSVGEIFPNEGIIDHDAVAAYLGDGTDELHLGFDFSLNYARFRASDFARALKDQYASIPRDGWPVHVLSNHDQSRAMSRLAGGDFRKMKLLLTMLLTQRGTPFLYYGDEIGMKDGWVMRCRMKDPVGIRYWPFHRGRDPARTPMQWSGGPGAGFTTGDPWLPIPADVRQAIVASQTGRPDSILEHTRHLISLRTRFRALSHGGWEILPSSKRLLAYRRSGDENEKSVLVILNFSRRPGRFETAGLSGRVGIISDSRRSAGETRIVDVSGSIRLEPLQALVLVL